jgi:hypothetical protein
MTRLAPALLLLAILGFGAFFAFSEMVNADPADEAKKFLRLVEAGNYRQALSEFGDNTCHCAPKGGYVAYLRYDTANDPSLAFLLGQKFEAGKATVKKLPFNGEAYMMPWDKPEDVAVYVPITFDDPATRPYFLPMDMAFGNEMPESEVKAFESAPDKDWWRAFTLRLRSRLTADVIEKVPPPKSNLEAEQPSEAPADLIPPELAKYQHPGEAANVKLSDGKTVPAQQVAGDLPRLQSAIIGFKIVRAGVWHRWAIKKLGVMEPVIVSGGKTFKLTAEDAQSGLR